MDIKRNILRRFGKGKEKEMESLDIRGIPS